MYTQYSLDALALKIAALLDDTGELYWSRADKYWAIWEALRVWGALTSYWRARGTFNLNPAAATPYYDLSAMLPTLRSRTWTLGQMVTEIQYMLNEAPNGISGAGMSAQVSIASILDAVQRARNRFALDAELPVEVAEGFGVPPPPDGMVTFDMDSVYVHRTSWKDIPSGIWRVLWRQDAWERDHADPLWTLNPGMPRAFSESENAPLKLQLYPPPVNAGTLEALEVESLMMDLTSAASMFNIHDEWVHAVKYQTLAILLSVESQLKDPARAQYCDMRYKQSVEAALTNRSTIRVLLNGVPLPVDSLAAIDMAKPFWRNQTGKPTKAGVVDDLVMFDCIPDQAYGVAIDVVQVAPLPTGADYIQIGPEDIPSIVDYAVHILTFKAGGKEFEATFPKYDSFLSSALERAGINKAKMRYLKPMLDQPDKEQQERPDREERKRA
jgi:hypothetical protein